MMIDAALGNIRFGVAKPKSRTDWHATVAKITAPPREHRANVLPTDPQVIGAVQRVATKDTM
jgi:3D-(3,5/4)-trihydroxycyclohexane-1,2-dione acylhydrolase (decyclizing)